jgi:uncharacterized repeat protein (TIGR01451 family)
MKKLILSFIFLIGSFVLSGFASAQDPDITISTNATWESGTYTYNNILITNNAVLTLNGAVTINAQSLIVNPSSFISANGKGYPAMQGPGAGAGSVNSGSYGAGAGYGGNGSNSYCDYALGGFGYGDIKQPSEIGSGGGATVGGAGGGAISINIAGSLILNGTIMSNGADGKPYAFYGGGGSGGSIYITTGSLSGSGSILANGGKGSTGAWNDGPYGGGGGGGRIALYYDSISFTGLIQAVGGKGDSQRYGGAGSIFTKSMNQRFGDLLIDNNNNSGAISRAQDADYNFDSLKVFNKASALLPGNVSASNIFIKNGSTLDTANNKVKFIASLISIESSSKLQGNLDITANNLAIDQTSALSADNKGYSWGQGPGAGPTGTGGYGGGGGYAGKGSKAYNGVVGGLTYGSSFQPIDLGSGGGASAGGAGGGAIKLIISEAFILNGTISSSGANGKPYAFYGGGGSGGSVYLVAGSLTGAGSILTNGGKGSTGAWNDGPYGGGGGGGRIAVYYSNSSFSGKTEAKGGAGYQSTGENGTVVFQGASENSPFTFLNLIEKSFTVSTLSETLSIQPISLRNVIATGDLNGSISFTNFEIAKIATGSFVGKGFSIGEFEANLEGIAYRGSFNGITYFIPSESKIYLKGELSGDINGICDGYISESSPQSGTYDKYMATWKLNRLGTETVSVTTSLEGNVAYLSPRTFNSQLYLYQANMEGSAFGYYTGPLSAVVTHLRLADDSEYRGKGLSIISYNSSRGQGEAYSYNRLISDSKVDFSGLFEAPILGKLSALLDEAASPKTLSGTIERMDFGVAPQPDLNVRLWSSQNVSPGDKINYVIEYRNDGLKSATEAIVCFYPDLLVNYKSASQGAYYNNCAHRVTWNLGALPAKSIGYLSVQTEIPWGLPAHLPLDSNIYISDIVLHSTEDNGIINGIYFDPLDINGNKDFEQLAHDNNAKWYKLYASTNFVTGPLEAYLVSKDISTSRNGVGDTNEVVGNRPVWIGYSGGTTTLVNQAKNNRLSGNELYLISPQLVTQEDLETIKSKFNKIIIYQGDDLCLNIVYPPLGQLTREGLINMAKGLKPPDTKIEELLGRIEGTENKVFKNLWILGGIEGNKVKINWMDDTSTEFTITNNLQSGENIEVLSIPGIRHSEWPKVLNDFRKQYGRLPIGNDIDKLKEIFMKSRGNVLNKFSQQVITANDPNEIVVSPEGEVRPGDQLSYTINYENTGEGIAFGVYITDTLEEGLDASTIEINSGGTYDPDTRTLSWFIGEVQPGQKGLVSFNVKVKADALDKSEVINFATIYFPSVPQATRTNGAVNRITTIIDNVPPTTTITPSILPNQAGWNDCDVTISLTATDNEGGLGVEKADYSFDGLNWVTYIEPFVIANEGLTKIYYKSTDNAGNVESPKSLEIKIDKTPPIITVQASPQPNSNGWNNTDVSVSFNANDNLSGIKTVTDSTIVSAEGVNQVIDGEAVDAADNETIISVNLSIDKTKPQILINSPQENKEYFHNETIPLTYVISEDLSQIGPSSVTLDGVDITGLVNIQANVGKHTLAITAVDKAGNQITLERHFSIKLKAEVIIKPEVFVTNRGIFIAFVKFPRGYNIKSISDAICDGASGKKIISVCDVALIIFNKEEITETPIDTAITIKGHFSNGLLFEGSDTIKKVINRGIIFGRVFEIAREIEDEQVEFDKATDELLRPKGSMEDCDRVRKQIRELNR